MIGNLVPLQFNLMELHELETSLHNQWRAAILRVMAWRELSEQERDEEGNPVNTDGCKAAAETMLNYANRIWTLYEKISTAKLLAEPKEGYHDDIKSYVLPDECGF